MPAAIRDDGERALDESRGPISQYGVTQRDRIVRGPQCREPARKSAMMSELLEDGMSEAPVTGGRGAVARRVLTTAITMSALAVGACNNESGFTNLVSPTANGIVTSFSDTTFDFATLRTFAMPDTIVALFPAAASPTSVPRMFDQTILNQVRLDLLNRGFTAAVSTVSTRPDFVILVGVTATSNYNAWAGYSWFKFWGFSPIWDFFTPRFTDGWSIVYPWFPMIGSTSYDRGTLIIDVIPTSSIKAQQQTVESAWAGVAAGILDGPITTTRLTTAIDQMFALTPFFTAAPRGSKSNSMVNH